MFDNAYRAMVREHAPYANLYIVADVRLVRNKWDWLIAHGGCVQSENTLARTINNRRVKWRVAMSHTIAARTLHRYCVMKINRTPNSVY